MQPENCIKSKSNNGEPTYNATERLNSWAVLPTDVKRIIFNFTDGDLAGLYRSRRVSKDWKNTIEGFTGFWEQQAKKMGIAALGDPQLLNSCINYYKKVLFDRTISIQLRIMNNEKNPLSLGDTLNLEVVVTNKTDQIVNIIDTRSDLGSFLESGYAFRYSMFGEEEAHNTSFCAPLMKVRSINTKTEFPPHHKATTSVTVEYKEKLVHYYSLRRQYDGPVLSFTKFAIPAKGGGKFKLWVEYDQTKTVENYTQNKNGIRLWKGKVRSNTVTFDVK